MELLTGEENLEIIARFCHLGAAESRLRAGRLLRDFDPSAPPKASRAKSD
jgi:hypothetical protein